MRIQLNRSVTQGAVGLLALGLVMALGPLLIPYGPEDVFWDHIGEGPSFAGGHLFGVDGNGRDLLLRTLLGGRISLAIGITATLVSVLIGVAYGALAGYFGGAIDGLMMRFVDVLYCLPFMFFAIALTVAFGNSILLIFAAIGATGWLTMARIVRGQTLSLRTEPYIDAAIICGVPRGRIIARHIIPNLIGPLIVYAALTVPQMIVVESFLSFLGLGVQEPSTSWGSLIAEGATLMEIAPWVLIFPGLLLTLTLLFLNLLADGLRDRFDVRGI